MQALEKTEKEAVSAQRQQLISGLRSDDRNIFNVTTGSDSYSPSYAIFKGKSKPIDLYKTGAFNEAVFVIGSEVGLTLESADTKSALLQENYGEQIFGLGTGARIDYFIALRPAVILEFITALNIRA